MNRSIDEWIVRFNKKIPAGFKRDERFTLFYFPAKGVCEIMATEKMLVIGNMCGDGRFWQQVITQLAKALGLKVCGSCIVRDEVIPFMRLFGFKLTQKEEKNGLKRYNSIGKNGEWGIASECVMKDGRHCYVVTWEVK